MRTITYSEKETFAFAKKFAAGLKGGEVIGLVGDLGAGKTIFAKGLAAGLGVKNTINSPTFVLMKVYQCHSRHALHPPKNTKQHDSTVLKRKSKITKFVHVDAYRIKKADELSAIGLEEYFNRPDTVVVIEWADKIKKILPNNSLNVNITAKEKFTRFINIIKKYG
jgi:tRNA threonylcarbamoyladenosine biosynthesis protein TsaE